MELLRNFVPTSKAQLLQVSIFLNKGDLEKAQQMFDFYSKNLDLPDFDPIQPNWVDNTKSTVNGLLSWFKENKDEIAQGYDFIRSVIQSRGALPPVIPPETPSPLPPINE